MLSETIEISEPLERKVSDLEERYVAILYCLRVGRLGNASIFRSGRLLCNNSLFFEAWHAWKMAKSEGFSWEIFHFSKIDDNPITV